MRRGIERLGPADLMFLALQSSTVVPNQFGAILVLDTGDGFDVAQANQVLADRVHSIPRLRQRVLRVPLGCGRPVWVDDGRFTLARHVAHLVCPAPGDERAMLDVATEVVVSPLSLAEPLWRAAWITGLAEGRVAFVLVVQHALADGIGGLAVLDAVVDAASPPSPGPFPIRRPSSGRLAVDALRARIRALGQMPAAARAAANAMRAPRSPRIGRAAPCSLLRPTGPLRQVAVARARLVDLRAVGHQHGATVNDVVLAAVAKALQSTLRTRGEHLSKVVIGIPVAARAGTTATGLSNRFSETRAVVPADGDPVQQLERIERIMRSRLGSVPSAAALTLASLGVRAAVALGVYDCYMRRQRYLHTVLANVHGPRQRQSLCGAPITQVVPLAVGGGGNVTVTFAALSYAGTLTVTVTVDPGVVPDLTVVADALQSELDAWTGQREEATADAARAT